MKEMSKTELIGKRIQQARIMCKMSLDDLCEALGKIVTKQSLSNYEKGDTVQPEHVLIGMSRVLKVSMDFFRRPFTFDINEVKMDFRKKQSISVKEEEALKMKIQDEVEKYLSVEQLLDQRGLAASVRKPSDEVCDSAGAVSFAREVREWLKLGESAIPSVFTLMGQMGIKVISTGGPDGFDGVSGVIKGWDYVIVLNKRLDENVERRRFTVMHELGHLLMGEKISEALKPREVEKLCHAFASEMLLPTAALRRELADKPSLSLPDLKEIQMTYGISADAIMKKLVDLGAITGDAYKRYNIKKNVSEEFKEYMEESLYEEQIPNKLQEMTYQAVMMGLMTPGKAAEILGKSEKNVVEDTENTIKLRRWEMN